MWKKGKYYSHPHDLGKILLQEWGARWTLDCGTKLATHMWARLKTLIQLSRGKDQLDLITIEDVKRGIKMMNNGTAVGIEQWSPAHWEQRSPEALGAIAHLFNHVKKHGVWRDC